MGLSSSPRIIAFKSRKSAGISKKPGKFGRSDHSDDLERSPLPPTCGAKCWFTRHQPSCCSNCQRSLRHHLDQVGAAIRGAVEIVQYTAGRVFTPSSAPADQFIFSTEA